MSTRRAFFRSSCRMLAAASMAATMRRFGLVNAAAQSSGSYKALVCVFLFGGNDGNNLVVPLDATGYADYSKIRSNLALSSASLLPIANGKNPYGLHANLKELQTLYNSNSMAIVANVGPLIEPITRAQYQANALPVPVNLFSHADQQMEWQTATLPSGSPTTGWAGRVADKISSLNGTAAELTSISVAGNSLFATGATTLPATVVPGAALGLQGYSTSAALLARLTALQQLLSLDSGVKLVQTAQQTTQRGITDASVLKQALASAPALVTAFPATTLGAQLQQIAKLIQVRNTLGVTRQIFFALLGGFDTHSAQIVDQGNLFTQLSPALNAFYEASVELGVSQNVVTFTESDFGRTLQPATDGGTDHAWGNHHLVIGGSVKGGAFYGQFPELALGGPNDTDVRGRWIPTTSTDQYGATLASWFGVSAQDLASVFPNLTNFQSQPKLGFV